MSTDVERLKKLRVLFDEGFITKQEYDARRLQMLEGSSSSPFSSASNTESNANSNSTSPRVSGDPRASATPARGSSDPRGAAGSSRLGGPEGRPPPPSTTATAIPMLERSGSAVSVAAARPSSREQSSDKIPLIAADKSLQQYREDSFLQPLVTVPGELQAFCRLVKDERSKTLEEVAAALVVVFRLFGGQHLAELFGQMCEHVVAEECAVSEHVLAQDTLYKKVMAYCLREMLGRPFLQEAFGSTLSEIVTYDIGLDASRADASQELSILDHLFSTAQTCFDCLKRARPRLPRDVVEALALLRTRLEAKFERAGHLLPERYLFGLFTQLVVHPHPLILARAPGGSAQRSLIALAKVLQTAYSGLTSGSMASDSDSYAAMLARFVNENYPIVESFLGQPAACPVATAPLQPLSAQDVQAAKTALANAKNGIGQAPGVSPRLPAPAVAPSSPAAEEPVQKGRSFTARSPRKEEKDKDKDKEKSPSLLRSRTATLLSPRSKEKEKSSPLLSPRKEEAPVPASDGRTRGKTLGSAFKKLVSKDKDKKEESKPVAEVQMSRAWAKGTAPTPELAAALEAAKREQKQSQQPQQPQQTNAQAPPISAPAPAEAVVMAEFDDDLTDTTALEGFVLHNPLEHLAQPEPSWNTSEIADAELEQALREKEHRKQQATLRAVAQAAPPLPTLPQNEDKGVEMEDLESALSELQPPESPKPLPPPRPHVRPVPVAPQELEDAEEIIFTVPSPRVTLEEKTTPVLVRRGAGSPVPEVEVLELNDLEEIAEVAEAIVEPADVMEVEKPVAKVAASVMTTTTPPPPLSRPKKPSGAKGRRAPTMRGAREQGPEVKSEEELMEAEATRAMAPPLSPGGGVRKQPPPGAFVLPGLGGGGEEGAARPAGQNVLKVGSAAAFGSGMMPKFDPTKVTLRKAGVGAATTGAAREAQQLAEEKRRAEEAARREAEAESEWNELAAAVSDEGWEKNAAAQKAAAAAKEEEEKAKKEEDRKEREEEEARLRAQEEERARQARQKAEARRKEAERRNREEEQAWKTEEAMRKQAEEQKMREQAEAEQRAMEEELARREAEHKAKEEIARKKLEALRAEKKARAEAEKKAREEEAARQQAEQKAREEEARREADERARREEEKEAARLEAERLEAEERAKEEAARVEAERLEAERLEAERLEAERLEAERLEAERLEAERLEAEQRARDEEAMRLKKAEEEEAARRKEAEERAAAEEEQRRAAEAEAAKHAKKKKEAELAAKAEAKAKAMREKEQAKKEEEQRRKKEESARKAAEAAERAKREQEEQQRAEEALRKAEAEREEKAAKRAAEKARAAEERKQREAEEAERRAREEEERQKEEAREAEKQRAKAEKAEQQRRKREAAEAEERAKAEQLRLQRETAEREEEEERQKQKQRVSNESSVRKSGGAASAEESQQEEAPKSPTMGAKSPTLRVRAKSDAAEKFVQRVKKTTGKAVELEVVPEPAAAATPTEMPCAQCGAMVAVGDSFCTECGAVVAAPAPSQATAAAQETAKSPTTTDKRERAGTKKDMRALIAAKAAMKKK